MVVSLLSACSSGSYNSRYSQRVDSAPAQNVDIHKVANAEPRHHPRSKYGNPESYDVRGQRYYVLDSSDNYVERGTASWYGKKFHGHRTSSGEPYNMYAMTAAHKTLPLPTYLRVTNIDNGKTIIVKVNDRGPFVKGRIIDLSYVAAQKLEITARGTGRVEIESIDPSQHQAKSRPQPQAVAKPVIASPVSSNDSNLYLQVGLFKQRDNAEQLRSRLMKLALPAIRVTTDTSQAPPLYRVRIGPLAADSEADQLIEMLASQGHSGFRIRVD